MAIESPDINTNIDNEDKNLVKTFEGKIIKNLNNIFIYMINIL